MLAFLWRAMGSHGRLLSGEGRWLEPWMARSPFLPPSIRPRPRHTQLYTRELRLEPGPRWDSRVGGKGTPSQPTWQGGQQQRHFLPQLLARLCLLPWKL